MTLLFLLNFASVCVESFKKHLHAITEWRQANHLLMIVVVLLIDDSLSLAGLVCSFAQVCVCVFEAVTAPLCHNNRITQRRHGNQAPNSFSLKYHMRIWMISWLINDCCCVVGWWLFISTGVILHAGLAIFITNPFIDEMHGCVAYHLSFCLWPHRPLDLQTFWFVLTDQTEWHL